MNLRKASCLVVLSALLTMTLTAKPVGKITNQADKAETVAKIAGFLKDAGYEYKKADDNVWVIIHKGKSVPNQQTLVVALSDMLLVGVVVAEKKDIQVTADSMFKLLHLAHDVDYMKVGIDDDGDLFVRSEVRTRALNLSEFKDTVERVFTSADRAYLEIKPYLKSQ